MSQEREFSAPLPLPHSTYDDSSSGEDEDQYYIAQPVRTHAQASNPNVHDSESDAETESDSDLPTKIIVFAPPVKAPEDEPDKKKLKLSEPDQSLSKKSASTMARIWSQDDEMVLLRALSEHHSKNGRLPSPKDYTLFLSKISGYIGFPVTEKQLANKIRVLKHSFEQKKRKGPNNKITKPHAKTVFEICTNLFQDGTKASKNGVLPLMEANNDDTEIAKGAMANMSMSNSASENGASETRSYIHLESLITEMIGRHQCESWLKVKNVIERIGELGAQSLEARTKMLRIDAFKLHAREEQLKAELFGFFAEGMADE